MSVYDDLVAEREKYGPTMTDDECVELCNAVAWKNRLDGWGLNFKDFGTHGERYDGKGCAHDILHNRTNNHLYDVLRAAGAESVPVWSDLGPNNNSSRPWVAPIIPEDGGNPEEPEEPEPPKPPTTLPSYEALGGDATGNRIGAFLFYDYERAGQPPNAGMGIWMGRCYYDAIAGMDIEASIQKHRAEWCGVLGIPVDGYNP